MRTLLISFFIIYILFFAFTNTVIAQVCGPNCPVCSGTIDGKLTPAKTLSLQGMYIPTGEEEYGMLSLKYGASEWLDLGLSYTFKAQKVIWNARVQLIKQNEDNWRPGFILGTGSIRAGRSDQSIYANVLKTKEFSENFAMSFSGGIASLASDLDKIYGIGNVSLIFKEKIATFVNFDGINFHEGATWTVNDWFTAGFILVESKDPAIFVNITRSIFNNKDLDSSNNL